MDNERRASLGIAAIRTPASITNVWRAEDAETAVRDVLAYIAHACDRLGLEPASMFNQGLASYVGDFEDGPPARKLFDGTCHTFASMRLWGE